VTADNRPRGAIPVWARAVDGGWRLDLRIQPGARRSEVVGPLGAALKIRVAAPADDGKANAELVRLVAERLGVPRRAVRIVRGEASRDKTVEVTGAVSVGDLVEGLGRGRPGG
jgi:uncharacterized protein